MVAVHAWIWLRGEKCAYNVRMGSHYRRNILPVLPDSQF